MIEKTVLDHLTRTLAPVKVCMEVPVDPPSRYVVIEKTGVEVEDYLWCSTFAVQSHAETLYETAVLSAAVVGAMDLLPGRDDVTRVRLNSEYNYTNTAEKRYRYQAVFDIYHY